MGPAEEAGETAPPRKERAVSGTHEEIQVRVHQVVARVMNASEASLGPQIHFVEDLRADSLRVMELILELQEEFGIEIPDEAIERIRTVGQAVAYVRERLPSA
jgi:acyl carrier protein